MVFLTEPCPKALPLPAPHARILGRSLPMGHIRTPTQVPKPARLPSPHNRHPHNLRWRRTPAWAGGNDSFPCAASSPRTPLCSPSLLEGTPLRPSGHLFAHLFNKSLAVLVQVLCT